ncbi:hypothetical protein WA026_007904 [Henosepilachna vigintioctopunctata]
MRSSAREALEAFETDQRDSLASARDSMMSRAYSEGEVWDPVKQKANIMASFVPDEVLTDDFLEEDIHEIQCCLLYGRVSGLNKLVTKYMNQGTEVVSELTEIINKILGQMVQEVLAYGGDVLKFGVNSLVAIWKGQVDPSMGNHVHLALDCAIVINKHCTSYIDEKDIPLCVHLAVTAGELLVTFIEGENSINMIIFGKMLDDIKAIRKTDKTEDVISSAACMKYVYLNEYINEPMADGNCFKISGLSPAWRQVTRMSYLASEDHPVLDSSSSSSSATVQVEERNVFSLRPITMKLYFEENLVKKMKKFVKESVAKSIEFEEPLQNLTEIRHIIMATACIKTKDIGLWNLLTIGQQSVKIFQRNALKFYGNIQSIEFFDKEIFILMVFGLRGFRHTLECKHCLLVCLKSKNEVKTSFPDLESVSVGVCRGKSFCTTVGHSLRRDYMLMGSTGVRSELLSLSYIDKVTCDETVFIHSKLEHGSFKLQEKCEKYSKFFPETIYEFLQDDALQPTVFIAYPHPSVGNNVEIDLFKMHLQKWLHGSDDILENILLIKGFSKEGKTRMIRDMISNAEPGVPVNYFRLHMGDEDKPFFMLANLFAAPLGLKSNMKTNQKKKIIKKFLPTVKGLKKLKAVYEVFQLVPPSTKITPPRLRMIEDCLKKLCTECFKTPWLIAIDDANFMDLKSWDVIQPLIETNLFFLLMTSQRGHQFVETETYKKHIAAVLRLKGLQKKYIATFACQVMNVFGIPSDLEFCLHKKSNGNPGWISNLLLFLLEVGNLVIKDVPFGTLQSLGLVCPPISSIFSISKKQESEIYSIANLDSSLGYRRRNIELWNVISDTWGDPEERDIITEHATYTVLKLRNCRVCMLSEQFSIENFDGEETETIYFAQILDSLTYNEQIFLKCCSILGVTFLRDVLYFVNPGSVHYEFAEIVKKMFEKQILVCAGGDFTERPTLIRKKMKDPSFTDVISCNCRSLIIEDGHKHLPKYASCGYLRFRATSLRQVVYNSLNKEQRIEFHTKAITYLQEQLKKCVSCGGGQFNIGPPNQAALMKKKKKKKLKKEKKIEFGLTEPMSERPFQLFSGDSSSIRSSMIYRVSKSLSTGSAAIQSSYFEIFDDVSDDQETLLFSSVVQHYKNRVELTRTFSYTDFSFCECDEKLCDYYYQMILHYRGKDEFVPLFQNMIDYIKTCLLFENISESTRVAREAQKVIERIFAMNELQQWKKPLLEAKVYNLQAQILLYNRNHEDALTLLLLAMKKYNRPLPSTNITRVLKNKWNKWRILISGILYENSLDSEISLEQYLYYCDLSDTLGLLCDIYMAKRNFEFAELTAMWSLIKALKAKANAAKIYLAYERVLQVYEFLPAPKTKILLETMALLHCHKRKNQIEFEEFRAITKLYSTLSRIRFQLGEITNAIDLGFIAVKMFFTQRFNQQFRSMLVLLGTYLIWRWSFPESAQTLSELDIYTSECEEIEGRILYYSQAMYFHSQLGYSRVSYEQCKDFCNQHSIWQRPLRNRIGINRLNTLMWLWCIRNEYWEEANTFMSEINKILEELPLLNASSLHSALLLTEGHLLFLVHKLDQMNILQLPNILEKIHLLFHVLDKYTKLYIVVEPMVMILKAYYLHIKSRDTDCFQMMEESIKLSRKHNNLYHEKFAEYLIKAWRKQLQQDVVNFWRDHSSEENLLDYVILFEEDEERVGFFTYPTPKYINTGVLPSARKMNWKKMKRLRKTLMK